nr:metallophosphoesterase family protein [Pseudonocardia spinosispora]
MLSDVHGNLPALRAAVARLRFEGVDRWLCAGDIVDYGPQPNECVAEIAALDPVCIAGNHELVALDELPSDRFSWRARQALEWTRTALSEDSRRYLTALPRIASLPGLVMAHGSLADPEEYIRTEAHAQAQLEQLGREHADARVLVLGHTHRSLLYGSTSGLLDVSYTEAMPFAAGERYVVNPGSVGQSRDRERQPRARFALLELPDDGPGSVRFFAEHYDHGAVTEALRAARLPKDSVHVRPGKVASIRRRIRRLLTPG